MNPTFEKWFQSAKTFLRKVFALLENEWVKRIGAIVLITYAAYFLMSQYATLKASAAALTINLPLLLLSSAISLITILLGISSWNAVIAAFGYSFPWIEIGRAQMLSSIGKYIPGHIWNYSSKIYLSHKFGLPVKVSGLVIVVELAITYLLAFGLCLVFIPGTLLPALASGWLAAGRLIGGLVLIALAFAPLLITRWFNLTDWVKQPPALYRTLIFRALIWIGSSYGFHLLGISLGYPAMGLPTAVTVVTASFFVGFLALIAPDGMVVREAIIIFLLRHLLTTPDATLLSLVFRFQLVVIEFSAIAVLVFIWRLWKARVKTQPGKDDTAR